MRPRPREVFGYAGDILAGWVQPHGSGRAYIGFGASSGGAKSFVLATNSSELLIQDNAGFGYSELADVPFTATYDEWYHVEVEVLGSDTVEGRVYASDGATLLESVTGSFGTNVVGNLALRAFGDVDLDSFALCWEG